MHIYRVLNKFGNGHYTNWYLLIDDNVIYFTRLLNILHHKCIAVLSVIVACW